ncbi:MAG TPA: hypothetical protein PLE99_05285 [Candidatus Thiothrix moscowensis]|uniref:hypothetical protein n=1 Tax=unclassified Thiothrix TaxID=2636184 RepID=UPI0025D70204|nr:MULTISPECIES: hypothetical protein [unclassified Thiothrix]HRJ52158.1 hypothetical protein [Candidatus Thiothrix moscowensis]HRJ92331.1 hypothetical protein [Candidatus Thiothrix moscowensis]
MTDLSQITDRELVLEIYRRIKGEDEMSVYRNYCYRAVFRPIVYAFDKINANESNIRMYQMPDWKKIEDERDKALEHFPD